MSTHPYGNNFRVTVTKYTDEDLDIIIDQLNLEIKTFAMVGEDCMSAADQQRMIDYD